jgi:outer membrane protein OmpA-like peptidoglycan-associated protein
MGKAINTAGDEMFPFVSPEGKLYFASDGHPGLGKLDIFEAVRKDGKISVENMGIPFNTPSDDFGLTSDEYGHIYFSSNRSGGIGDDDIYVYQAPLEEEPILASTPNPLNPNQPNGTSGSDTDLKMVRYFLGGTVHSVTQNASKQGVEGVEIKIYRLLEDTEELVSTKMTTKEGTFGPIALQEDAEYMLLIEKANYLTKRESFSMYGRSIPVSLLTKPLTDTTFLLNIDLDQLFIGKTFRLENIYYDLDKADIRVDAAVELDKLVRILQDNPALKIELGSHTDSRGSDMYNIRLSQRRAESVINYLMTKGIDPLRLQARGYGETELLIENARTEDEHQVNRRTEFKVLEIGEAAD